MSDEPVRGVVVAHGAMAEGMVDAVRRIAGGAADALIPLSNEGMGPAELQATLRELGGSWISSSTGTCPWTRWSPVS